MCDDISFERSLGFGVGWCTIIIVRCASCVVLVRQEGVGGVCPLFVEVGFGVFSLIVDEIGGCFLALVGFFCDF